MSLQNYFFDFDKGLMWKYNEQRMRNGKLYGGVSGWKCHGCQIIKNKYHAVMFNGKVEKLHRIIFSNFYNTPLDSMYKIDHIDRNTKNNTISNLRLVTSSENSLNTTQS